MILKTSFKDNTKTIDERTEIFADFIDKFNAAAERFTGKKLSKYEREKWGSLADLLILELEIAAKRTDTISSLPAFLTEVIRRKLFTNARHKKQPVSRLKDSIGQTDQLTEFEIKPLDDEGKLEALQNLIEFKDDDFLDDFKKWYSDEDWEWLKIQLKNSD